jgi:endo-1,3(4)-beta-glucanase
MDAHVGYQWQCHNNHGANDLLHYGLPHHKLLLPAESQAGISEITPPTKGSMTGFLGRTWLMKVDKTVALSLDWLPERKVPASNRAGLLAQVQKDFGVFARNINLMFDLEYYFTGKFFQKVAQLCLLLEEFKGRDDGETQQCALLLGAAFKRLHTRNTNDANERASEGHGPASLIYDTEWGGVVTRWGYYEECWHRDFGNACYNDHHYHFGYYVASAAIAVHLRPSILEDSAFKHYVDVLIRDTTNPSAEDTWFPLFRGYDWFAFHSWSHGVNSLPQGKDQESVSEDINLQYGLILWGRVTNRPELEHLGATQLSCNFIAIEQYFLMRRDNPNHAPNFAINHVTGIFFESEIDYNTWFGGNLEYIHGIQMLPLTPALLKIRDAEFCKEEWDDVLGTLPAVNGNNPRDGWTAIIITGSLAMFDAPAAWDRAKRQQILDNGMTRAWTLYWIASQPTFPADGLPLEEEVDDPPPLQGHPVLRAVEMGQPDTDEFIPISPPPHRLFPVGSISVQGAKATNKFWTHWKMDTHRKRSLSIQCLSH